jgi:hypothetical protein
MVREIARGRGREGSNSGSAGSSTALLPMKIDGETAWIPARNSSLMATSIGEERKIERKRGVGGLFGKGLKARGVTGGT